MPHFEKACHFFPLHDLGCMTSAPLSRVLPFLHYKNGYYVYRSCRSATRFNLLVNVCVTFCSSQMEGVIEMQSSNILSEHLPPQIALQKVFIASARMIPSEICLGLPQPINCLPRLSGHRILVQCICSAVLSILSL